MSAAQPADPARPYLDTVNGPDDAAVIPLKQRRGSRGALRAVRGRWSTMNDSEQDPDQVPAAHKIDTRDHDGVSALAAFANTIETSFIAIGQSLTDPATAAAFQRTLDLWERTLQGSHAQGIIDAGQLAELTQVLQGMREAPRLV